MGKQGGSTYPGGLVKMEVDGEEEIVEMEPEAEVSNEPVEGWNEISALKDVMKRALCHDGLVRGIRECTKNLDKRCAHDDRRGPDGTRRVGWPLQDRCRGQCHQGGQGILRGHSQLGRGFTSQAVPPGQPSEQLDPSSD